MRYVWATVFAFLLSATPVRAGGMSGGTGIGGLIEEIINEIQEALKGKIEIDTETVRRIIMRLCTYGEAEVKIGNKTVVIKWKIHKWEVGQYVEVVVLPDP